jgi:tetratricopeptide (TPR) repeat protein
MFLLGMNYKNGSGGYAKNLDMAEEYFRKAAAMKHPDADVALGFLLLGRRKNKEAFQYIKKAAETTGNRNVALTASFSDLQRIFGLLLAYGHGCDRDEKSARRWLLRSGKYKDKCSDVDKELQLAAETLEFEKAQQLKTEGLTLHERKERYVTKTMLRSTTQEVQALERLFSSMQKGRDNPPHVNDKGRPHDLEKLPQMLERARQGSGTAKKFFQAQEALDCAITALQLGDYPSAFQLFRKSHRLWTIIQLPEYVCLLAHNAAKRVFDTNPRDADALYCILLFESKMNEDCDQMELVEMAKTCVRLDPRVADYHHILGCLYGFVGDYGNSLRSVERALELEMEPEWLYEKGTTLRLTAKVFKETPQLVIKAYEDYIAANEADERKIPEAYYCLGFTYLCGMKNEEKAREYREKARKAERPPIRLPVFGPVDDDFPPKHLLDTYFKVKLIRSLNMPGSSVTLREQVESKKTTINPRMSTGEGGKKEDGTHTGCASCGKAAAQSCGRCRKVRYCDRQCQKQHWKEHKKACDAGN